LRGSHVVGVEAARDLGEALPPPLLVADARNDLGRKTCPTARTREHRRCCLGPLPPRGQEALELVDGDETCAPVHLHGLDEGEDAPVEGRAADAERFGRPRLGVGEPLHLGHLADDHASVACAARRRRVAVRVLPAAAEPTAWHTYTIQQL
jgi:hypothetical protein